MTGRRERKWIFLGISFCTLTAGLGTWFSLQADEESGSSTAGKAVLLSTTSRPDRSAFMGARTCLDCHRSEYVAWLKTAHASNRVIRFEGQTSGIDTKYRELTGNVALCYTCHTLPAEERFGRRLVESGTSCESCHGAAGGADGWLNRHAVYGPNVTRLDQETPEHFAERIAFCESAGMIRSGRQYAIAKKCLECHISGDALLYEAGHKVSFDSFSLIPYLLGEVRHNFHLDQQHNSMSPTLDSKRRGLSSVQRVRLYFIVEQLARMETALNHLAGLPDDQAMQSGLADELTDILDDAAGQLEEFADVLLNETGPDGETLTEDEVEPLLSAVAEFEQFEDLESPSRADAAAAAQRVSVLAASLLTQHDGRRLGALDLEFLQDLGDPVGDALEP